MRRTQLRFASGLLAAALLAAAGDSRAQDTQYLLTDVLLLIDTSGSMALTTFRDNGKFATPRCGTWAQPKPVNPNAIALEDAAQTYTAPDRWTMLLKALTGTPAGMACVSQPRNSPLFHQEYALGNAPTTGSLPIDANYYYPYNRPVATGGGIACTPAPSWDPTVRAALMDNALSWPTANGGPIYWRQIGNFTGANPPCTFTPQDEDGLMDAYKDRARFGLMTFDPMPNWNDAGTARIGIGMQPGSLDAVYLPGIQDTWSYYQNWMTDNTGVPSGAGSGNPGGCTLDGTALLWENGARNPAAPPWEGRLMTFGAPNAPVGDIVAWNERVQQALLAIRPYGQTPIAAMLHDAKHFLLGDNNSIDPYIGGTIDPEFKPQLQKGCRKRKVILFTDGGPNWDLRPGCEVTLKGVAGKCPYPKAQDVAKELADNNIPVFVVGLSVSTGVETCTQMLTNDPLACTKLPPCDQACPALQCAYGYCVNSPAQEALSQCCVVKSIAEKGGTNKAYFVENQGELFSAFGDILKTAVAVNKSRSVPVAAGLSQASNAIKNPADPNLVGARFFSSYQDVDYDLQAGTIERQRYNCMAGGTQASTALDIDPAKGDKFEQTIDQAGQASERLVYTVVGAETKDGKVLSERSIRPWYKPEAGQGDLLGTYGVNLPNDSGMVTAPASGIAAKIVPPEAILGATKTCGATGCCFPTPSEPQPTAEHCRNRFIAEEFGLPLTNSDILFKRKSVFGAVQRSTPVVVAPPTEVVGDTSYASYRATFARRGSVMYAASVDGQLHAFDIWNLDKATRGELWTFMPPAVLTMLDRQFQDRFKATPQKLLDGPLTVRDVAGVQFDATTGKFLTRTKDDAKSGTNTKWYTILVGSFGAYGGYYALDVSWPNPTNVTTPLPAGYHRGPRFLWQLTTDLDGAPIFGDRAGVPSIATLYFKMPGSAEEAAEHAVAILPGGLGGSPTNDSVPRTYGVEAADDEVTPNTVTRKYVPADNSANSKRSLGGARSITIVRLDTGEVVRTMRYGQVPGSPLDTDLQAPPGLYASNRVTNAPFDAPIAGQLVSYPAGAGSVSDRAYVGDNEGHLWRIDLANPDPALWKAEMFFDAYPKAGLGLDGTYQWNSATPIQTPPIISTDLLGRVTVAFSTGDQEMPTADGRKYNVWSLTEKVTGMGASATFSASVNWYLNHLNATDLKTSDTPVGCTSSSSVSPNKGRFQPGERVLGPLSLFNSVLYFTTYDPNTSDPANCTAGYSYLWGVHYMNAGKDAYDKAEVAVDGPEPRWVADPSDATAINTRYMINCPGTIPFGAAVSQQPSCVTVVPEVAPDSFLALGGQHFSMSSMSPGPFQVTVQAGKPVSPGSQTNVSTFNLRSPPGGAIIDSWATIVD